LRALSLLPARLLGPDLAELRAHDTGNDRVDRDPRFKLTAEEKRNLVAFLRATRKGRDVGTPELQLLPLREQAAASTIEAHGGRLSIANNTGRVRHFSSRWPSRRQHLELRARTNGETV
jgi:hypothetical protein